MKNKKLNTESIINSELKAKFPIYTNFNLKFVQNNKARKFLNELEN